MPAKGKLKRFTDREKNLLVNLYNSGKSIKEICFDMDRQKSSICYALDTLAREGRLVKNRQLPERTELKLHLPPDLMKKIRIGAFERRVAMSKFVELTLRRVLV